MEKALGIRVVRHITKKPAGDAAALEKHFRWSSYSRASVTDMASNLDNADAVKLLLVTCCYV